MSSPSRRFECRWQPSRRLLLAYVCAQALAAAALVLAAIPYWASSLGLLGCFVHALWVVPRHLSLTHPDAVRGLRCDEEGWSVRTKDEWVPIQMLPDSMALPQLVVFRYRLPGRFWAFASCIAADALPAEAHRQLRVRLRFTRHRWAVAE